MVNFKAIVIALLLVAALLGFGAWCIVYDQPCTYAAVREQGVEAGKDGIPVEACPYSEQEHRLRYSWLQGWMDGFRQRTKK